jgi:phosphoribosyl 1,2-cyclic phosphodiesterase
MLAISLQSGSNGNCIYVEANGVKLLFDAGICGVRAEQRLSAFGREIRSVDALIISHDHADHISYAGVYQRKYGLPIYITPKTFQKAEKENRLGKLNNVNYFLAGEQLQFENVIVQTMPTPHDAVDGAAFVISSGGKKLGILTDLGHVFNELVRAVASLEAVFIESNYDPEMLAESPYPEFLKRRIRGPQGHLSNREAAELLQSGSNLKWACLSHISEMNNSHRLALKTHHEILGQRIAFYTASREMPTGMLSV